MPLYSYECGSCQMVAEVMDVPVIKRDTPMPCPSCGGELNRSITAPRGVWTGERPTPTKRDLEEEQSPSTRLPTATFDWTLNATPHPSYKGPFMKLGRGLYHLNGPVRGAPNFVEAEDDVDICVGDRFEHDTLPPASPAS